MKNLLILIIVLCTAFIKPAHAETRILAFGDSITAGYGLPIEKSYPSRLQAMLREKGYNVTVINAGVSGDTSSAGLTRFPWAMQQNPDVVILALGANDMLRGIDPHVTRENLRAMIERCRSRRVPVLLVGMKAFRNYGTSYAEKFENVYTQLVERFDVPFYPFMLEGVAQDPKLNQEDGIHPNADGAEIVARNLLPSVEALLKR